MIKTAGRPENGFGLDALNNAESMVWVNDLVTNLECHMSPKSKVKSVRRALDEQSCKYSGTRGVRQRKTRQKWALFHVSAVCLREGFRARQCAATDGTWAKTARRKELRPNDREALRAGGALDEGVARHGELDDFRDELRIRAAGAPGGQRELRTRREPGIRIGFDDR